MTWKRRIGRRTLTSETPISKAKLPKKSAPELTVGKGKGKPVKKVKNEQLKAEDKVVDSMRSQWTDTEKTALFEWLLGADANTNTEKLKVNAGHVFKKVSSSFHIAACTTLVHSHISGC